MMNAAIASSLCPCRRIHALLATYTEAAAAYRLAGDRLNRDEIESTDYEMACDRWATKRQRFRKAVLAAGYDAVAFDGKLWLALDGHAVDLLDGKPLRVLTLNGRSY